MKPEEFCNKSNGKPWENRAEGGGKYDCWGLVIASFRDIEGIELPSISGYSDKGCDVKDAVTSDDLKQFKEAQPTDGAIMTVFDNKGKMLHVGRCLCGRVLHSTQAMGVRWETYQAINRRFKNVRYYKYA